MSAPGALLYDADQIAAAVDRLAAGIAPHYAGLELTAVVVLDGALIFAADLLRRLPGPTRVETVKVTSYVADRPRRCSSSPDHPTSPDDTSW